MNPDYVVYGINSATFQVVRVRDLLSFRTYVCLNFIAPSNKIHTSVIEIENNNSIFMEGKNGLVSRFNKNINKNWVGDTFKVRVNCQRVNYYGRGYPPRV